MLHPKDFLISLKISIYLNEIKANDSWGKELRQLLAEPENPLSTQIDILFVNMSENSITSRVAALRKKDDHIQ